MQASHGFELEELTEHLPPDFEVLRREAAADGQRFLERLYAEWQNGVQRFDRAHEILLAIRVNGELAGIGGMTADPDKPSAMRMRRFYIRPAYRRHGLGRALAMAILGRALPSGTIVTVNTDNADAAAFWQAVGFKFGPKSDFTRCRLWLEMDERKA
ncbi:GNAT family N-acetyltransferase [Rhizobium freirei]|uniref:GNAT family N-acetyltransferase n=1 Tax=Rhizobium freirei TaxID=1353277 RepID=UPI0003A9DDDB|nr:GNAT family N-acetyltransferase [Rhizobium freirei]